jgi:hypothetical protein
VEKSRHAKTLGELSISAVAARRHQNRLREALVKFLLLINIDPSIDPTTVQTGGIEPWIELTKETRLDGNQLRNPSTAKTVRVRGGKPFVTDGPFAETKEFVGGFDIIECSSLDEAVEIAAAHPVAQFGSVEVREFHID